MKILVVDDHKVFCDGLRLIFEHVDVETTLIEAEHSQAAFEMLKVHPDIGLVMLDINLPDRDGIEVLHSISRQFPTVPVIMLTATESRHVVKKCFRAGASGYVPKSSSADILINAIRLVQAGGVYVPPNMVGITSEIPDVCTEQANHAQLNNLTPRQRDVLHELQLGYSNKQIAEDLGLSESTVKSHISAILHTLDLRSRVEAALFAQELNSSSQ